MTEEPIQLNASRVTDADKAKAYREELVPLLEQVAAIVTRASRDGIRIGFSINPDQFGVQRIAQLDMMKSLL